MTHAGVITTNGPMDLRVVEILLEVYGLSDRIVILSDRKLLALLRGSKPEKARENCSSL